VDTLTAAVVDRVNERVVLARGGRVESIPLQERVVFPRFSLRCPEQITAVEPADGKYLFVGSEFGRIFRLGPGSGFETIHNVRAPAVRSLQYQAKYGLLAAVDAEGALQVFRYRPTQRPESRDLRAEHSITLEVSSREKDREVVTIDSGYVIAWRDWASRSRVKRYGHPSDIRAIAISPNGDRIASCFSRSIDIFERSRPLSF